MAQDNSRIPYRHPQPKESPPELVIPSVIPDDERVWVPQGENVWFRPLCLCASRGYWMNLLRVRKSGVLSRHRHPQPVHGYVIKGRWRYLEHDWVAQEGGYVYEAPGETHTLVVDEDVEEMITLFQVNGVMIYVDPDGGVLGYEDVFTKIDLCRAHYEKVGLGAGLCGSVHPLALALTGSNSGADARLSAGFRSGADREALGLFAGKPGPHMV